LLLRHKPKFREERETNISMDTVTSCHRNYQFRLPKLKQTLKILLKCFEILLLVGNPQKIYYT